VQSGAALLPAAEFAPRRAARACTLFIKFYFKFRVGLSAVLESSREISRFRERHACSCVSDAPMTRRRRGSSDPHPDKETRICGSRCTLDWTQRLSYITNVIPTDRRIAGWINLSRHFQDPARWDRVIILRILRMFNSASQRSLLPDTVQFSCLKFMWPLGTLRDDPMRNSKLPPPLSLSLSFALSSRSNRRETHPSGIPIISVREFQRK